MKYILALDTTTSTGTVALWIKDAEGVEVNLEEGMKHGRLLLPAVEECLHKAGIKLRDVDVFACGIGPGSYTGTRIGVMTAKALAFSVNKQVIGVSSLAALALSNPNHNKRIIPVQNARRDEVYTAIYEFDSTGLPTAVLADKALTPEEARDLGDDNCIYVGSGIEAYPEVFSPDKLNYHAKPDFPSAIMIGRIAAAHAQTAVDPMELDAVYMRRDDAPCTFERFMN